jgi:hypothetical protein
VDKLTSFLINESNLTMLQACAYSVRRKSEFNEVIKIKYLKKKSGEKSTIKRQAVDNLKKSIYSLIWLYIEGYLEKGTIINLLDTVDVLRDLTSKNKDISNDVRLIKELELIVKTAVDKP